MKVETLVARAVREHLKEAAPTAVQRRSSLIARQPLLWRLELDHQPVGMDFDPDYVGGNEVSIVAGFVARGDRGA